jgi:ABC-type xylose transport system permease subunit
MDRIEEERPAHGPSARTRAFVARRGAMAEAAAVAAMVEAARRERQERRQHAEYHNPVAVLAGLVVLALLIAGFVFVLDRFRSDPWFADCPTGSSGNCR